MSRLVEHFVGRAADAFLTNQPHVRGAMHLVVGDYQYRPDNLSSPLIWHLRKDGSYQLEYLGDKLEEFFGLNFYRLSNCG